MNCDLCGNPASHWSTDYQDLPERDGWKVVGVKRGWCAVHLPPGAIPLAADEMLPVGVVKRDSCEWCRRTCYLNGIGLCGDCERQVSKADLARRVDQRSQTTLVFLCFSLGAILGIALDLVGRLLAWWE